eukprot:snap_masked-scaffold_2-processed-gene-2.21-mRNA-1 protein AED:1.00 eAED:1.00 QI:0/0/0/0/1/1/3/0/95
MYVIFIFIPMSQKGKYVKIYGTTEHDVVSCPSWTYHTCSPTALLQLFCLKSFSLRKRSAMSLKLPDFSYFNEIEKTSLKNEGYMFEICFINAHSF